MGDFKKPSRPKTLLEKVVLPKEPPAEPKRREKGLTDLEKSDVVFALDTWIRAYKKASQRTPDGEVARRMARILKLKRRLEGV